MVMLLEYETISKLKGELMEPRTPYRNPYHQLTMVSNSQQSETCWPFRFKLIATLIQSLARIQDLLY